MPARHGHCYAWVVLFFVVFASSCQPIQRPIQKITLTADSGKSISLNGAGNEWIDFRLHVNGMTGAALSHAQLRLVGLDRLGPDARWYHVENEVALLALPSDSGNAVLTDIPRDGNVWVDLHIPSQIAGGDYHGVCQVVLDENILAEIPLAVHVYDFSLPDQPTLTVTGEVSTEDLRLLHSGHLPDSVEPLIQRCQENRLQLWFSDLQPIKHSPETEIWKYPKDDAKSQPVVRAGILRAALDNKRLILCPRATSEIGHGDAWFYPGSKFESDDPVESVLLKRLRDGEEYAEYLDRAEHTSGAALARTLVNLLVQPVSGPMDRGDELLAEPLDAAAFDQGKEFLARLIEGDHFSKRVQEQRNLQLIRWIAQHSSPRMRLRATDWAWDDAKVDQLDLKLAVDIYNPSDIQPTGNTLEWSALPAGWALGSRLGLASLPSHRITHAVAKGAFDASQLHVTSGDVSRLRFINGFDASGTELEIHVPVASCDRRTGAPIIDGSLSEWSTDDLICNGPLVQQISNSLPAGKPTQILANFSDTHLYLAFRMDGIDAKSSGKCELFIQPLFADNSVGGMLSVTCTPAGICKPNVNGSIQFAFTDESNIWRGELAVPWGVIRSGNNSKLRALRFNFIDRRDLSNVASWAGPVNPVSPLGRISGILVLRNAPGDLVR